MDKAHGRYATPAITLCAGLLILAGLLARPWVEAYFATEAQEANQATLNLVAGGVQQAVRRFEPLPELIAETPALRTLLRDPDNQGLIPFINEKLRLTARSVDVSDIFLMDREGRTLAASNYRKERSFVGRNFDFRPYFQDALRGRRAQFHALGTTSNEPGFFFAAPVLDGIDIIGVLAVKVTTDAIEAGWAGGGREILVVDGNGIIFLTSQADLRYVSLAPISDGARQRIAETRQFPIDLIKPLPVSTNVINPGTVELQIGDGPDATRYLSDSAPLELPGWHAVVLTPLSRIVTQALSVLAFWVLGTLVLAMSAYIIVQRRIRLADQMRSERTHRALLEETVTARTRELRAANASLRSEVAERRSAEERLRKTQSDLVQAGKLAALGQMSAALSHEINQPLAAVKSYADNAVAYLQRKRVDEARENLSHISKMTDRMARISGHLRNFARRPGDTLGPVSLGPVIAEAISVVEPLARKRNADILYTALDPPIWATGGRLRLQQVVVNLLSNAMDAMAQADCRRIEVWVEARDETVDIVVRDHGPGVSPAHKDQLFEPFFTTKPPGDGMGLGLSIAFNIVEDFGGRLSAENHPAGGGLFRVRLQRANVDDAEQPNMAAEG